MIHARSSDNVARTLLALVALGATAFTCCDVFSQQCSVPSGHTERRCWLGPGSRDCELRDGADLSGLDLRQMMLYGTDHYYSNVNFDGANLSGADLEGDDHLCTKFSDCSFRNAIMRRIEADWVIDRNCNLTDADIAGSTIGVDADQLRSTMNYRAKDLSHTAIRLQSSLPGFDFAAFDLRGTEFLASEARFRPLFKGADFTDADIRGATIRLTAQQLQTTKNYRTKDLSDTSFTGDFGGVSFRGFDLTNTTFEMCDLSGCDFTDAEIRGMRILGSGSYDENGQRKEMAASAYSGFTKEQLYTTKSYQGRDLDAVQLHSCDLRDADFSNQTLGFFYACDLLGANFRNADHSTGPNDDRSGRRGLPFFGPHKDCNHANSIGFQACNFSAEQFYSTRIYASKKFQPGCMMAGMDLSGWDFSGFDLRDVVFDKSTLAGASLDDARGGDFMFAKGLTVSQVKSTWNYKHGKIHTGWSFRLPNDVAKQLAREAREAKK